MCTESPILRSWEITLMSRLGNMSQASCFNSLQGGEDMSIAWQEQQPGSPFSSRFSPFVFSALLGDICWPRLPSAASILLFALANHRVRPCTQSICMHTHLYNWKGKKRWREGTSLTHSLTSTLKSSDRTDNRCQI